MSAKFQNKGERDLFEEFHGKDARLRKKTRLTLPRLRKNVEFSYENVIFIIIAFIMSSVMLFSLGVEKGRREKAHIGGQKPTLDLKTLGVEEKKIKIQKRAEKRPKNKYVIQLAAFTNISPAEEEARTLKKEGYSAKIKTSGSYYQVFLEGFDNRKNAERILKKLKGRYNDGYIKKK